MIKQALVRRIIGYGPPVRVEKVGTAKKPEIAHKRTWEGGRNWWSIKRNKKGRRAICRTYCTRTVRGKVEERGSENSIPKLARKRRKNQENSGRSNDRQSDLKLCQYCILLWTFIQIAPVWPLAGMLAGRISSSM